MIDLGRCCGCSAPFDQALADDILAVLLEQRAQWTIRGSEVVQVPWKTETEIADIVVPRAVVVIRDMDLCDARLV